MMRPGLKMAYLRSSLAETNGSSDSWGWLVRVSALVETLRWSWFEMITKL